LHERHGRAGPLPTSNPSAGLPFRTDANAAFINGRVDSSAANGYTLAVNVLTGQTEVTDWPAWVPDKAVYLPAR
jgi:hypothetical protein